MAAWLARVSWADAWHDMYTRLLRTKPVGSMALSSDDLNELDDSSGVGLAKVLTTVDLVSLGVGSCVGTGMYVVAGLVAKAMAGPGVILSFIIAAMASILSGVCYAEFGVRVPKTTGSAYTYSYVTVGEFVAFLIGWNLILEYLIGTAAGASALSSMFDSLANHSISNYMVTHLGTLRGLGKGEDTYPDLLAMFIALLVTVIIALGVRNSVGFNNVLNVVNMAVWVFIVLAGLFFLSAKNWEGGMFLPYGWSGVMRGAATCFYAFIGFDIIATTGEEAQNPNTSIPYAITASLVTCLTAYVSVSVILTLMVPYDLIDSSAPLMEMFAVHGFLWGKYTVAVGSIAGLTVSLLGSLFPMPRVIYAMARDGLLFRALSHVSALTHTPAAACVASGSLAALLALLVSLSDLIEMMSIGTLLAYTLVSVCVLVLRYQPEEMEDGRHDDLEQHIPAKDDLEADGSSYHGEEDFHTGDASLLQRLLGGHYYTVRARLGVPDASARPTAVTGRTVTRCTLLFFFLSFLLWTTVIFGVEQGAGVGAVVSGLTAALITGSLAKLLITILQQPESGRSLPYMAPCVPFVPAAAILVNSYLMLKLSPLTWARFSIWCVIGLLIYACYGVWHSTLEINAREEQAHSSSYQRFDDHLDDTFTADDDLYPHEQDEGSYQGWAAPQERSSRYQHNQHDDGEDNGGYQCGPGGQHTTWGQSNHGFDDDDEED
uniref:probable cationic amino acid transporter isoform X1 n=1 Tax=Doryrhamphus excisus TaxID=161450 RepID=UPI0025ADA194|nr:probable cationic amino acid transporter isoform X1 [Doryrhamphus excisus]XP_057916429.1 probable cationic amino acid transporter isoform X1 [Doryrhamphus excisus]XP_057916430.1 probable cationic amino acid transporter isoform X1 [Doryrhamphus excisus]XP_057916431.1 probable cationic amino acid transporter isoform X1 [Doryrhamphus excisus]